MRFPGSAPAYPVPRRAAEDRLRVLDARIDAVVRRAVRSGWTDALEGELAGWREEAEALREAFHVLDVYLPSLPRCGCGKRCHPDPASALRHVRQLRLVNGNPNAPGVIEAYACRFRRGTVEVFHVGHGHGAETFPASPTSPISDGEK